MRSILSYLCLLLFVIISGCNNGQPATVNLTDYNTTEVLESVIADADSLKTFDFVTVRVNDIKAALQQPVPVLLCKDSLDNKQQMAQLIALSDTTFTHYTKNKITGAIYRSEIFGVYPARESDLANSKGAINIADCYRVEMYNYPLNLTSVAIVNIAQQKIIGLLTQEQTQPDIPLHLKNLAIKIAVESPEVQQAYGIKPPEAAALMASTKTSLNRTRCERSRHLCVAPTFVKDGKALWAIVDLTDHKLVGVRWTNTGTTGPADPMITERRLQDDKITACFCERETALEKNGWKMNYMLTSSDGLRITQVSFKGT
jgi:hypothetical protein